MPLSPWFNFTNADGKVSLHCGKCIRPIAWWPGDASQHTQAIRTICGEHDEALHPDDSPADYLNGH
jgi:hypothetical protein